jgi:hypothetical protein
VVLVESLNGDFFWDGSITATSYRRPDSCSGERLIDAYRIEYVGWSLRFTEWVEPSRVVEPREHNKLLQVRVLLHIENVQISLRSLTRFTVG